MRRLIILVVVWLGSWAGAIWWQLDNYTDYDRSTLYAVGPSILLFVVGLISLRCLIGDNPHGIYTGEVVDRKFTPAHKRLHTYSAKPVVILPTIVPDTWALQIKNSSGRTGWIVVDKETYDQHPIGSYYTPED